MNRNGAGLRKWFRSRRSAARHSSSTTLHCEPLEERTLLSVFDGAFETVMLTNARNDPALAGINGEGIGIAIIDQGQFAAHPDLQPNFVHWYDAVTQRDSSFSDIGANIAAAFDPGGDGSHVAGIAASSNPDIGVAPGARIIGIRALPRPGESVPGYDAVANALQWVVDHHQQFNIKVVNMSLGVYSTNINTVQPRVQGQAALIARLEGLGVTVVSAAGNNYASFEALGVETPAVYSTISVASTWAVTASFAAATTRAGSSVGIGVVERDSAVDRLAASSQRSTLPNQVAAPGQRILSAWNGAGGALHKTLSGTSMAAPLVSGTVALMQQTAYAFGGRYLSPSEVLAILRESGDTITDYDVPSNGRVPVVQGIADFGSETALRETGISMPRVNVYRALQSVRTLVSGTGNLTNPNPSLSGSLGLQGTAGILVTGADAGGGPDIKVVDARTGKIKFSFFAYDPHFTGGVRVAAGDVNGDGTPDVICAAGPGGGPHVTVFDGSTGRRLAGAIGSFFAYDPGFTGGIYVAAADVNGDGFADIVCGADQGGGPNVTVFSGNNGARLMSFFAYDPLFTGGVRVAAGDVNGDRFADIICGAGPGGGPNVTVFSGKDGNRLLSFFAYNAEFTAGLFIAAGDLNADGRSDIVTGAGPGGGPNVAAFSGVDGKALVSYFAYDPAFTGGVRVAAVDRNGDGRDDIVSVAGAGGGPDVRTFDPVNGHQLDAFFAYDPLFTAGLYVAAASR